MTDTPHTPHSPTPWIADGTDICERVAPGFINVIAQTEPDAENSCIVRMRGFHDYWANAAHIVKCVNERDTLIAQRDALREALKIVRVTITYPYELLNEQSETMKGQTQTTKFARGIFEQYRTAKLNPLWKNEVRPTPENQSWTCFTGIEIDSFPNREAALEKVKALATAGGGDE